MNTKLRLMNRSDTDSVFKMMKTFYSSPAVYTNGSDEIFYNDIENCVNENPYLVGYVFECEKEIIGYAMLAKSFSTEFGKTCIWIEDLYIEERFRGLGVGKTFFDFLYKEYTDCIFRLEVEGENERAVKLYEKCGFSVLPYMEMKK